MAIFRKINTSFWSDTFIQDLDNDHKLFYLYLLTNERTKQCGIYEISKKQMSFDLGYSIDRVSKLLKYFIDTDKIMYSESTKELALKNWVKFNGSTSPKVVSCVKSELLNIKDTVLIEYINGIYTPSQQEEEQEQEQEEEQEKPFDFKKSCISYGFEKSLVSEWLAVRRKKKCSNSKTAFELFVSSVEKSNLNKNEILKICVARSWASFNEEWLNNNTINNGKQFTKLTADEELAQRFANIERKYGVNPEPNFSQNKSDRTIFDNYEEIP